MMNTMNASTVQMTLENEPYYPNKCKWCGKPFEKKHNRQEYCSDECARYALLEQKARYNVRYRLKYKSRKSDSYWGMGSGSLGSHKKDDFDEELESIRKELRRFKLR